ncbi:TPM domain-containing protein [Croceicoccus gelatinilyticus]|uniref:TPM domain-containing protein n=1 Tax=Croceicoccus gelatinilyticus TaxID=2835536 RepID=UPI001BCBE4BB|nr:TPM domain-containing protein [Croceicoccus gelatinilyticus]
MTALFRFFAAFALLAGLSGSPAWAAYPERPEGPVLDQADIIPADQEAAMDARLRAYNEQTGRAVVVATVNSLDGETIEMYAANMFAEWGIGGAETDQGLLLLVAPNDRKVRIEVGYGLTPYVTDILSGRIIRNDILPAFKAGDYPGGINAGLDALITQMDLTPAEAKAMAEAAAAAEAQQREMAGNIEGTSAAGFVFWVIMIVVFMILFGRRSGGRRYRRGGGISPWVILWGASELARHAGGRGSGGFGGGGFGSSGGGFGGFGGGMSGGGGASGSW